jgi:hypothetical protein
VWEVCGGVGVVLGEGGGRCGRVGSLLTFDIPQTALGLVFALLLFLLRTLLPGRRCESNEIVSKIGFGHLLEYPCGIVVIKKFEIRNVPFWEISGFLVPVTKKNSENTITNIFYH